MPAQVSWLGLSAVYTETERELMSQLSLPEQTVLHALKSLTDGQLGVAAEVGESERAVTPSPRASRFDSYATHYTDPDDIPFGSSTASRWRSSDRSTPDTNSEVRAATTTRKRPIYAVVWTDSPGRQTRTKAIAARKIKAWKKWKERQGWKVTPLGVNAMAVSPSGERQGICLHEYEERV